MVVVAICNICWCCPNSGEKAFLPHWLISAFPASEPLASKKSHVDVLKTNEPGTSYWAQMGWELRTDILRYSFVSAGGANV